MKHNYKWVLNLVVLVTAILTIVVTTLGVLATPVIMSYMYNTWYWMFLYLGYLVLIVAVYLLCIRYNLFGEGGHRK